MYYGKLSESSIVYSTCFTLFSVVHLQQPPAKKALRIAETLRQLGFNVTFLGSKRYLLKKLDSLKPEDLEKVRKAFEENVHPRFMKEFFYHKPYGKTKLFKEKVDKADFEKLSKLIEIVGLLLQTKVYLFCKARAPSATLSYYDTFNNIS